MKRSLAVAVAVFAAALVVVFAAWKFGFSGHPGGAQHGDRSGIGGVVAGFVPSQTPQQPSLLHI